ncbi:hypothetical protein [Thalassococcus sp. S3]|uniref:hypothetical protein n=1 Tax=Thalassococcus sp. S3 TaxID=2017482 RepID=UPI0010241214|nr:hypothetical protein [Thalassococcus sp. S3]QBF31529.1 hypothetical protein CFI11_09915 [Thalassococcus sp. S3]
MNLQCGDYIAITNSVIRVLAITPTGGFAAGCVVCDVPDDLENPFAQADEIAQAMNATERTYERVESPIFKSRRSNT